MNIIFCMNIEISWIMRDATGSSEHSNYHQLISIRMCSKSLSSSISYPSNSLQASCSFNEIRSSLDFKT